MIIGIIAEYNPFHNGHAYHINKIKSTYPDSTLIVCLAGHFTQRGEPTLASKWTRAKWSVQAGADLVFELPFAAATANAELYAQAGVQLLASLGIDYLSFGSQTTDLQPYQDLSKKIIAAKNNPSFQKILKEKSFPKALGSYMDLSVQEKRILTYPNDILALEYYQTILKKDLDIGLLPVQRVSSQNTLNLPILSASDLRKLAYRGQHKKGAKYMPNFSAAEYQKLTFHYEKNLKKLFIYQATFKKSSSNNFQDPGINQYIYKNWILKGLPLNQLSTKKYTQARLQRDLIHILASLTLEDQAYCLDHIQNYHRLLAGKKTSLNYLKPFNIQTRFIKGIQGKFSPIYQMSYKETILRNLLLDQNTVSDYLQSPILL